MRQYRFASFFLLLVTPALAQTQARFVVPRDTTLTDEKIAIILHGAPPSSYVTIKLAMAMQRSSATFISDRAGTVDLSRVAPVIGSYGTIDPMGLFWSLRREDGQVERITGGPARQNPAALNAAPFVLVAESGGTVIATDTVWRRAVAANVKLTEIREGFTATLYEPPGSERRPAVVMLAGSQGGRMQPPNFPGGFASRGYVVMALAYHNDEGVPLRLTNVPLEYFENALKWLRARPNVDSARIGMLGGSKGAETILLVASTYPRLVRAVAAYLPGHVVWPGCCDSISGHSPSFTVGGKPLPTMPHWPALGSQLTEMSRSSGAAVRMAPLFMYALGDTAAVARAAIPVERMQAALLLVSGRDDGLWPSTYMSDQIVARLRSRGYRYPVKHLAYEGAGHVIARPYLSIFTPDAPNAVTGRRNEAGGTPAATQRAREESWAELLAFFDQHLRRGR